MNDFLEELESKIDALDEKERKKIIKKYQVMIEEKKEDGLTEKEAIKELGNVDDVAKEICNDYHVNQVNRKVTLKEKINNGIHTSAEFLAETCQEVIDYSKEATKDKPLVTFFELLLKIVILLVLFAFYKIPFVLLDAGLKTVFEMLFYPFNFALAEIFEYVVAVLYFGVCVATSIYMFKGYFEKDMFAKKKEKEIENDTEKKEVSKVGINFAGIFVKILLMVIVVMPMIVLCLVFLALTILAVYLVCKGIAVIGLSILLLSFFLLTLIITTYVTDAIDNKDRNHFFALCISIISLIIGGVLFVDDLVGYNYPKTLEESNFKVTVETLNVDIEKETALISLDGELELIVDNSILDNKLVFEATYYDSFTDIILQTYVNKEENQIVIYTEPDEYTVSTYMEIYNNVVEDLKNNNIFNYNELSKYKIKVYCNEKTKELIRK